MASYSGRARSQGFDPVRLPDTARRMLEASTRNIEAQRRVYNADIQQREEYGRAMEAKASRETAAIEANFRLQDSFTQAYTDQLRKNFDQLKKNAEAESADKINQMTRLGQFAPSILGMVKDLKEKNDEDQEQFGQNLIAKYGISKQEYNELRLNEAELQAEGAANNKVVERLKANGASPDEIKAIRDLDGWRLYGAQKQWAMSGKADYREYLYNPENRRKKYDNGEGRMMSLEEAQKENNGLFYNVIRDQLRADFLKPYSNLNPAFASEYLYKGVNEVDAADSSDFLSKQNEAFAQEEKDARATGLYQAVTEGREATLLWINSQGLDHKGNRSQALDTMLELAKSDDPELSRAGMQALENWLESPSGQDPKKTNEQLWLEGKGTGDSVVTVRSQVRAIEGAYLDKQREFAADRADQLEILYQNEIKIIRGQFETLTAVDYQKLDDVLKKEYEGKGLPEDMKIRMVGGDGTPAREFIESIQAKIRLGVPVDPAIMETPAAQGLTEQQKLALTQQIKPINQGGEQLGTKEIKDVESKLTSELKNIIGETGQDAPGSVIDMRRRGTEWFMDRYLHHINAGSSSAQAYEDAQDDLTKELNKAKGKNNDGFFALTETAPGVKSVGFEANFQTLSAPSLDDPNRHHVRKSAQQLEANPEYFSEITAFGNLSDKNSWISQVNSVKFLKNQQPPQWLKTLDRLDTNNTWQDIVNQQRELYGLEPIDFARAIPKAAVSPEVQRYLTNRPSAAKKVRALTTTYGLTNPAARYKPVLDLISSKESSNDTKHGGYDALNRGGNGNYVIGTGTGTERFGKPLIEMTVDEVRSLQRQGKVFAVGRYQFIPSTLEEQLEKQGIDGSAKFDGALQDQLAISYINQTISTYRSSGGDVIYGMGQRWTGLQKVSRQKIQAALDAMQGDSRLNASFQGIDFRPGVLVHFYTGGNIGPTSTGSHTDVKQADNPRTSVDETLARFGATDLDNFVMVNDREKGLIPISRTTVTSGYDSLRDGGTRVHRGLDFGTYEGDRLYLQNGARMIAKTKTVHGDKVTIELPDGRRFNFLHGRGR